MNPSPGADPALSDEVLEDLLHRLSERLHRIHEDLFQVAGEVSLLRGLLHAHLEAPKS